MKIKMVKTELPYCMTVIFKDGTVKYYKKAPLPKKVTNSPQS